MFVFCLVIFLVVMMYEALKVLRDIFLPRHRMKRPYRPVPVNQNDAMDFIVKKVFPSPKMKRTDLAHLLQTLLHVIQTAFSYFLMLIFMTFYIWLGQALFLGTGTGYFLFSWRRNTPVDINEHFN